MRARKRERRRGEDGANEPRQQRGPNRSGNGQRANRGGRNRNRRNAPRGKREAQEEVGLEFWGDVAALPPARTDVRFNEDPAAVPRSLGTPPLPGQEAIAGHYFAAVYERAVATAGALAAAGGLVDPDELDDDEDD
jgi:hypothetical protein